MAVTYGGMRVRRIRFCGAEVKRLFFKGHTVFIAAQESAASETQKSAASERDSKQRESD